MRKEKIIDEYIIYDPATNKYVIDSEQQVLDSVEKDY